jgi:hypothetical protein
MSEFPLPSRPRAAIVDDAGGRTVGWFYGEDEPSRRAAMNGMTRDEARRMAVNFTKFPDLLAKSSER